MARSQRNRKANKGEKLAWVTMSELLKSPMGIPYLMVTGPRWNCHAVIGGVGPLQVQSLIEIDIETVQKSAGEWTLVFYNEKMDTKTYLSSTKIEPRTFSQSIKLESGQYMLSFRYYHTKNELKFPTIKVDGNKVIDARPIDKEWQEYQEGLEVVRNHRGWFYYALHYYIFNLLWWRKWLPESFVNREFLPVGNPDTFFYYDILRQGQKLTITFDSLLLGKACIYVAFLNKNSFPVNWEEVTNSDYQSPPLSFDGYYLVRVHHKEKGDHEELVKSMRCHISE